jgi:hypothetical protein
VPFSVMKSGEVKDRANVGIARLGRELAHPHLLEHALTQR